MAESQAQAVNSDGLVEVARDYYDSQDSDSFYFAIWGGEDIHVGLYQTPEEDIATASRRTVERMIELAGPITAKTRVIDLGAGYGGAARSLADQFGCPVTCVNLSKVQNDRNRAANEKRGLSELIEVIDGSFDEVPAKDDSFDLVWSQDAILHAPDRMAVLREADRLLAPGGKVVLTDPMQDDDCPDGVLQPVLDRIHLASLASPGFYRSAAKELGWQELGFEDQTSQLVQHYTRVRQELARRRETLEERVSPEYIDNMIRGLGHWVDAGASGYLSWGIFTFQKPA